MLIVALIALLLVGDATSTTAELPAVVLRALDGERPRRSVVLRIGDDYAAEVERRPEGTVFWFEPGIHRLVEPIRPKDRQVFLSAGDAVLRGSRVLELKHDGDRLVATGQTQQGFRHAIDQAADGAVRAGFPETVFVAGQPLRPVASKGEVAAGRFYFDYDRDHIYLAADVAGQSVEAGASEAAFASDADGVVIANLTIEQFNSPVQHGAIHGDQQWTVAHCLVRANYGVGIKLQDGGRIVRNDVAGNGQMGLGAVGADILIAENHLHHNGGWAGIDPLWEGGGGKFAKTLNLVVRGNVSDSNIGPGLWTDIDNVAALYENNYVIGNTNAGILHEISYDAVIKNNVLAGNGTAHRGEGWLWGGQIQIQNSQNVVVEGNRIDMSGGLNGVGLIQQNRGDGPRGPYLTRGNTVRNNVFFARGKPGRTGGVADYREAGLLNGGNRFEDNDYLLPKGDWYWWGDLPEGSGFAGYQRVSGQDKDSRWSDGPVTPLATHADPAREAGPRRANSPEKEAD